MAGHFNDPGDSWIMNNPTANDHILSPHEELKRLAYNFHGIFRETVPSAGLSAIASNRLLILIFDFNSS